VTENELEILRILNQLSPRAAKSVYIREKLNIDTSPKNATTVSQMLGKLQVQGMIRAYKPNSDKKYWFITEEGKQSLIQNTQQ